MDDDTVLWLYHEFMVCQYGDDRNEVSSLYLFAARDPDDETWLPFWIGRARSFAERLPNYEKCSEAKLLGATHVHARVEPDASRRQKLERDLIQHY